MILLADVHDKATDNTQSKTDNVTHSMIPILQEPKEHTHTYTHTHHEFLQAQTACGYNWSYINGNNSDGTSTCPHLLNRESPENNEFSG